MCGGCGGNCGGGTASAFNEPASITLDANERAKVTFRPKQSDTQFFLPSLGISKKPNTTYEVRVDGTTRFGPAAIPPRDIDNNGETFAPPLVFEGKLEVFIRNFSSATNTYHVQPVGFERSAGGGHGA